MDMSSALLSLPGRAVQAGKGPAPRYKGAPVGELRDVAVRHLRGVLVSYAILTIQNPDMWGDDVSSGPLLLLLLLLSMSFSITNSSAKDPARGPRPGR